jgi:hypothetical protein
MIDDILYCNDGDWVESLSALVEEPDGTLKIIHWPTIIKDEAEQFSAPVIASTQMTIEIITQKTTELSL